jgi:DNA-binding GntR family transcriptional regulator
MSENSADSLVHQAIARLVGEDPLAAVILAAVAAEHPDSFEANAAVALVAGKTEDVERMIAHAGTLAVGRRHRQHLAVIDVFRSGDLSRARLLIREHLAEFPDDVVISWIATRC